MPLGAMMSLSLMAVPVLLDTTMEAAQLYHQWTRMYHYGHQVLPTMAVTTFLLYGYTAVKRRRAGRPWGIFVLAGLTTLSMLPFTWLVMVPTNNELFRREKLGLSDVSILEIDDAKALVVKWSRMHLARCLMPLAGAIVGMIGHKSS
ncbi:hypothetical protein BDV29DRAFT_196689 [Aspergillus leporis]|uniref:DUF1772-domain-containing protein n=1 Tax=Aspergillus leporis TaxID=41062 RepID=A0A5N5WIS4_9EURO|nr:hypothetical protein BDV29DRAFT_196689 [Aspergillus leporis]